jgi:alanyl-tRNA synthetase
MDATKLRQVFRQFYQEQGHAFIRSASLIPEHDPSVLFTTAGMHPLVPFLLGEPHPAGKRLANWQKCLRTNDIVEVGDDIHLTFFEMLGVWSLGDYWKPEALRMSYTFLTERLGLDGARLHVTCFAGDDDAPGDIEAAEVWQSIGIPAQHITFLPKAENWWGPVGTTGPCGPDSEMFYDMNPGGSHDENPATNPRRFWEVGNNVFLQYDQQSDGSYGRLKQRNIDVGLGFDRLLALVEGVPSAYETELFVPIVDEIRSLAPRPEPFAVRVITDHVRAAMFVLADGIKPGNADQPYVARRLIRRAVRYGREIGITGHFLGRLGETAIPPLSETYPELEQRRDAILVALEDEETRFQRTLARGEKEFAKTISASRYKGEDTLPGPEVFRLYETYGFPVELTEELAHKQGLQVDMDGFRVAFEEHQAQSRQGSTARFRGGLADRAPETTALHTATHLLHQALRQALGPHVEQRGSNITVDRLRFDFTHGEKLTPQQIKAVEEIVNEQIRRDLAVQSREMSLAEAKSSGAIGLFEERYGDQVKVYSIGDFSREICGGPHVEHTGELGHFRILKEEAVGAGVRRIKAALDHSLLS